MRLSQDTMPVYLHSRERWSLKAKVSPEFFLLKTAYVLTWCACVCISVSTSYLVWCIYIYCCRLKHFPSPPSWLQSSPKAVISFGNSCNRGTMTSKTDIVPTLLRGDLLFIECVLCVKGFPYNRIYFSEQPQAIGIVNSFLQMRNWQPERLSNLSQAIHLVSQWQSRDLNF